MLYQVTPLASAEPWWLGTGEGTTQHFLRAELDPRRGEMVGGQWHRAGWGQLGPGNGVQSGLARQVQG